MKRKGGVFIGKTPNTCTIWMAHSILIKWDIYYLWIELLPELSIVTCRNYNFTVWSILMMSVAKDLFQ